MLQAHQGYLAKEVQLMAENSLSVTIPMNKKIMIIWEETEESKTLAEKQNEALKQFRAGIKEITDEPIDDEFRAIISSGITIDSEVNL